MVRSCARILLIPISFREECYHLMLLELPRRFPSNSCIHPFFRLHCLRPTAPVVPSASESHLFRRSVAACAVNRKSSMNLERCHSSSMVGMNEWTCVWCRYPPTTTRRIHRSLSVHPEIGHRAVIRRPDRSPFHHRRRASAPSVDEGLAARVRRSATAPWPMRGRVPAAGP
jgi:hypothetical protein